jgi:hypothetical protein
VINLSMFFLLCYDLTTILRSRALHRVLSLAIWLKSSTVPMTYFMASFASVDGRHDAVGADMMSVTCNRRRGFL